MRQLFYQKRRRSVHVAFCGYERTPIRNRFECAQNELNEYYLGAETFEILADVRHVQWIGFYNRSFEYAFRREIIR